MTVERIDAERCIGCGLCFNSCSADVIRMDKVSKKAVAKYPEDCVLCAWCIAGCPVNAVVFTPGRKSPIFTSWG